MVDESVSVSIINHFQSEKRFAVVLKSEVVLAILYCNIAVVPLYVRDL